MSDPKRTEDFVKVIPWALIAQWPANGEVRKIKKYRLAAAHKPRTTFSPETLVVKRYGRTYERVLLNNRWTEPLLIQK